MELFTLYNEDVDTISDKIGEFLQKRKINRRVIMQLRLVAEETLLFYQEKLGTEQNVQLHFIKSPIQPRIELRISGSSFDPFERDGNKEEENSFLMDSLLGGLGLAPVWEYRGGDNRIFFLPKEPKRFSDIVVLLVSILAGFLLGVVSKQIPGDTITEINRLILAPCSAKIGDFLVAVSTLFVFFAVVTSISNIGDMTAFHRFGKRVIKGFALTLLFLCAFTLLILLPFFSIQGEEKSMVGILEPVFMLLFSMVPDNLLTPFTSGNVLQVIFLAMCAGITILPLSAKVPSLIKLTKQCNDVALYGVNLVSFILPFTVFQSIFEITYEDSLLSILATYKYPLLTALAAAILLALFCGFVCIRFHFRVPILLTKLIPTAVIAAKTDSVSAAFPICMDDSVYQLGIEKHLAHIALPLGQFLYNPGYQLVFLCGGLCLAEFYKVTITVSWLIKLIVLSYILAIASPPVSSISFSYFTMMFLQLGIPMDAVIVVIIMDPIVDRIATVVNLSLLQLQMIFSAKGLGVLDEETLRKMAPRASR